MENYGLAIHFYEAVMAQTGLSRKKLSKKLKQILDIGDTSVYKRTSYNSTISVSLSEAIQVCRHFDLSLDEICELHVFAPEFMRPAHQKSDAA